MPALTHFTIITPSAIKFEGDAEIVIAPGSAGDIGPLANHAPLLTTLRPGVVRATIKEGASETRRVEFAVDGGFMQILKDRVIVLTDRALERSEIDVEAARADLKTAEEAIARKEGEERAQRAAAAFANARLELTRRPG